ncbi:MAG: HAMP domain-containing histidine kinase, partial [Frankia sp.]|nr:HAMP domain-containing histidine kinase [Frankia sp.]
GFLISRDLTARAQDALDQDLARRSFDVRSLAHDRELYLVESANFATNIQGMYAAVQAGDRRTVQNLLGSVLALKSDVSLLVATDASGRGLVELHRSPAIAGVRSAGGGSWRRNGFVAAALADRTGARHVGFVDDGGRPLLVIAAPVCPAVSGCATGPRGAAIVGISIESLAAASGAPSPVGGPDRGGVVVYDANGRLLASAGLSERRALPRLPSDGRLLRQRTHVGRTELETVYLPFEVQGQRVGTLGVSVAAASAFASVRDTAIRLGLIVLAVMLSVIAVGALLSRSILTQLRALVATNRALGTGQLSARAPVVSNDELGELARGVNQMAEQLEATYDSLELRVAQRTEEIQRLLEDRTDFFAAVSHDLRTPLAVIRSQALMMLSPKFRDVSPSDVAKTIVGSSDQLLSLINELLEMARAEAGRLELDVGEVRLQNVVKDLRRTIHGLAESAGLRVTFSVPKDLPPVLGDPRRLREVLLNLVDNAVKYTPPGGRVTVAAAVEGERIVVRVMDTGCGVPAATQARIFEPFYRAKGSQPQHGHVSTGLGLALTKRFVEAHGGEISLESSSEQGATFMFWLPRYISANGARARRRTVTTSMDGAYSPSAPAAAPFRPVPERARAGD